MLRARVMRSSSSVPNARLDCQRSSAWFSRSLVEAKTSLPCVRRTRGRAGEGAAHSGYPPSLPLAPGATGSPRLGLRPAALGFPREPVIAFASPKAKSPGTSAWAFHCRGL